MLKLKNIEISGFKSFVDPVETTFADGITAIVGPNGCGKSNLSEAITWVLGEQSAKSLRGGKMEDVIFNGTNRRKPLGMAEVSLTLATDEDIQGAENGQLIIGRRIFRSGESQYRLNDKIVRLKQIKDILADTGLGVRAYSVIEQGRIGQILSSKPTERRKLIEEAAGVTRYKARKRLAELKLEDATANRMRLDDIIAEVERALRSLKRQSNAARRYKQREGDYRTLLHTVLASRYAVLHEKLSALAESLTESSDKDAAIGAELSNIDAGLAQARQKLDELTREIAKRHQRTAELGAKIEGRQEFIRGTRATIDQVAERIDNGVRIAEQRQRQMHEHLEALEGMEERKHTLVADRTQALGLMEAGTGKLEKAHATLQAIQSKETELRQSLLESSGQVSAVQQRSQRNQMDSEKAQFRNERAEKSQEEKKAQVEQAKTKLVQAKEQTKDLEDEKTKLTHQLDEVRSALDATVKEEAVCSEACEQQRLESAQLEQRQAILTELAQADEERRQGVRDAVEDIGLSIGGSSGESIGESNVSFLDELIHNADLPKEFEASIDSFLEPYLDAVVLPDDEEPLVIARELAGRNLDAIVLRHVQESELSQDPYAALRRSVQAKKPPTEKPIATKTVTKMQRVPVQREVQRTVEETVEVPHEVSYTEEVEVEVPVAAEGAAKGNEASAEASEAVQADVPDLTTAPQSASPARAKRGWLDILLSPFRRSTRPNAKSSASADSTGTASSTELFAKPPAKQPLAKQPEASSAKTKIETRTVTKTRTEMRTEVRPRVITETVTEYEEQEVEVEVPVEVELEADTTETGSASTANTAATGAPGAPGAPGTLRNGIVATLGDVLGVHQDIARALPPAVLVESAKLAQELCVAHPHIAFLTTEGLFFQGGVVRLQSETAAPGVLGRSNEMHQVAERLPLLAKELTTGKERLQQLVAQRTEKASNANKVGGQLSEKKQQLAVATARRQDQQHRVERLEAEGRGIAEEHQEIKELMATIGAGAKELAGELGTVQSAHGELEKRFDGVQAEAIKARDLRQEARTEGEGRKSELRLLEERVESHAKETSRLNRLSEEVSEFLTRWSEDRTGLVTRKEELGGSVEEARVDLQRALEDRTTAEEAKVEVQQALDGQRTKVREFETAVTERRDARDAARAQIQELRVGEAQQKQQATHIAETFEKEFDEPLDLDAIAAEAAAKVAAEAVAVAAEAAETAETAETEAKPEQAKQIAAKTEEAESESASQDDAVATEEAQSQAEAATEEGADEERAASAEVPEGTGATPETDYIAAQTARTTETAPTFVIPQNLPELMAELDNLKQIMDRMGPVNVLAAEEFEEQEERHVFLAGQRADVQASIESLRKTIKEINATSIERFMLAFNVVNQYFGEAFEKLFSGGEACMRLLDEDDPLDSGIEIVARPPGKRLQNIQLMSGGEKALTAIALLFSLFRHKPSPFCILDEVDAPLDDANCIRFIETLKDLAKDTQFLVVTHNKLTMEAASTLYGVTMAEKGVTKLVGVNIDELHPEELLAS